MSTERLKLKFVSLIGIEPVPAGSFAVVSGDIPDPATMYDELGRIKRSLWSNRKIFKRKINAEKYKAKLVRKGWADFLQQNGMLNPN